MLRLAWSNLALLTVALALVVQAAVKDSLSDSEHYKGKDHDAKFDHDAFLGKDEATGYDELSPEKSKERLAMLVPKIDKDGDGEITEDEMKNHINFMQQRYVTNDVARTWKQYNDKEVVDGKLSWKHYRERVYGPEGDAMSDDYAKMIKRDRNRWQQADVNKDDNMEKEEYACFMHPEDCGTMKEIVVKETLEDIDKDGDGKVTLEEYISELSQRVVENKDDMYRPEDYPDMKKGEEPEWVTSERQMFKEHRDKDGDGKLNMEEMKEWISPTGFDHAAAEAHHLIHMADDDKDGKLSIDEVLLHYDVFVGSQATDYGEQLQKHDPSEL